MSNKNLKTSPFYNLLSAFFAFLLWGGWAYYINSTHAIKPSNTGIIAGLTQGAASFIITFIIVHLVTHIYNFIASRTSINHSILRLFIAAVLTVSITGTGLLITHHLMKTPHITKTIAPALIVAFLFSLFTVYKLQKTKNIKD